LFCSSLFVDIKFNHIYIYDTASKPNVSKSGYRSAKWCVGFGQAARYDGLVGIQSKLFEVELIVKFLSVEYCLEMRVLQLKSST
jgi:hypothetical protein